MDVEIYKGYAIVRVDCLEFVGYSFNVSCPDSVRTYRTKTLDSAKYLIDNWG